MAGEKIQTFLADVREDVSNVTRMVQHRIRYGSPPLLAPSDDLGLNPVQSQRVHQERIKRRRKLLGLEYREWTG